jgi:hypothetical protein
MSYLARFLKISGFKEESTDKTDETTRKPPENEILSVLSVPSLTDTKKSAPIPEVAQSLTAELATYESALLEISGLRGRATDKTDETPLTAPETEVSSVLSVPPPSDEKKSASVSKAGPGPLPPFWVAPDLTADEVAALDAILAIPPGAPWPALGELIEEGRRHNEAVRAQTGRS